MKYRVKLSIFLIALAILTSCSINKAAMKLVGNALSSGTSGTAFTGDDDPDLVGDALPFALKLYETILTEVNDNPGLCLTTGSGFVMYANAWVQGPADMLTDSEIDRKKAASVRARKLYLRGRDYVLKGIDLRHPGFRTSLDADTLSTSLAAMTIDDVPFLYWAGAGWMAAYATDPFDVELGIGVKKAAAMMERALALNESWGEGSIHEFFISYYGSLPRSMGGSDEKARLHFAKAVEFSKGLKASPYVALASAVSVSTQNMKEFTDLLEKALAIDVNIELANRLANILAQRKARWLMDHRDDRILSDKKEGEEEE